MIFEINFSGPYSTKGSTEKKPGLDWSFYTGFNVYPATVAKSGVESQGGPRGSTTHAPPPTGLLLPPPPHEKLLNLQLGPGPGAL